MQHSRAGRHRLDLDYHGPLEFVWLGGGPLDVQAEFHYPHDYEPPDDRSLYGGSGFEIHDGDDAADAADLLTGWRSEDDDELVDLGEPPVDRSAPVVGIDVTITLHPRLWQRRLRFADEERLRASLGPVLQRMLALAEELESVGETGLQEGAS